MLDHNIDGGRLTNWISQMSNHHQGDTYVEIDANKESKNKEVDFVLWLDW